MKRFFLSGLLLFVVTMTTQAQVYLVDKYAPSAKGNYTAFPKSVDLVGGQDWKGGFVIQNGGYAKFELKEAYESIRFVVGQRRNWNPYGDSLFDTTPSVVTVWADNVKVFDGIVHYDGVPQHVTAKINGAKTLLFRIIQGPGVIAFGEVTLWKEGQTPKQLNNLITGPAETIELVKDLKPYVTEGIWGVGMGAKRELQEVKNVKVNRITYPYGLLADMSMAIIGDNPGKAHFYLQKQYDKLSFIVGPVDGTTHGKGWVTVKADGKIIYELEMKHDDTAKQVTLDIKGCDRLSFHTEQEEGNMNAGIVKIMVYPEGSEVAAQSEGEMEAPIDPRLKTLPDVTRLVSQIRPYAIGSDLSKQIYDGSSDHITFSMGGVKFNEGFILHETANFWDDNLVSYAVFDLGNEFDYVRFTVGYVSKSWTMENDYLRVWADDELILQERLLATSQNKEYILPLKKCRKLRFENNGQGAIEGVAAFGLADLVVYRGEDTSVNPFSHSKPVCPDEIDLIDLGHPYIHYVASRKNDQESTFHDGSTKREYFELNGQRIYKGFLLQASSHFSLDAGVLSGSDNAAGAVAGSIAVGAAFVPIASVGSAVVGSTLAGAAALIALAAGGTKVENSCAAFNTYGEYNSVTFTVACMSTAYGAQANHYTETLLIGVNGEVAQEITVYESMEPQTITIPIEGCEQLMFWLVNSRGNTGDYLFYDLKLSKEKLPLNIPKKARLSKAQVSHLDWDAPEKLEVEWKKPQNSSDQYVNEYLSLVTDLYHQTNRLLEFSVINYEVHTFFLETNAGQTCKAIQLMPIGVEEDDLVIPETRITLRYKDAAQRYKEIQELRTDLIEINLAKANAGLGLVNLGLGAVEYGKYVKAANAVVKTCTETLKVMARQKSVEVDFLAKILNNAIDIDSKKSTEKTIFCPLFEGDKVPEEGLMLVDVFYTGEE